MLRLVRDRPSTVARAAVHQPAPVAPRLGRAFSAVAAGGEGLVALHSATVAFVARLKADGLPPERVAVALEAALAKYGGLLARPSSVCDETAGAGGAQSALYDLVSRWCAAAYADPSAVPGDASRIVGPIPDSWAVGNS